MPQTGRRFHSLEIHLIILFIGFFSRNRLAIPLPLFFSPYLLMSLLIFCLSAFLTILTNSISYRISYRFGPRLSSQISFFQNSFFQINVLPSLDFQGDDFSICTEYILANAKGRRHPSKVRRVYNPLTLLQLICYKYISFHSIFKKTRKV